MKFIMLELDLLVAATTAPSNSYANIAERSTSILNLALKNGTFARSAMPQACRKKIMLVIHEVHKSSSRKKDFRIY